MLADQHGEGMEFVVLEKAEVPVKDYVFEVGKSISVTCTFSRKLTGANKDNKYGSSLHTESAKSLNCQARQHCVRMVTSTE